MVTSASESIHAQGGGLVAACNQCICGASTRCTVDVSLNSRSRREDSDIMIIMAAHVVGLVVELINNQCARRSATNRRL